MNEERKANAHAYLFNLRFLLPLGRFIDGHLHILVSICHDNAVQRRELSVNLLIIDRPESVESELVLVPLAHFVHLVPPLVTDTVVDKIEQNRLSEVDEWVQCGGFLLAVDLESGDERSLVVGPLNKCVYSVSILHIHIGISILYNNPEL